MKFWVAEVKNGEPFKVSPGEGMVLHLSQANFGEMKKEKGNESACLFVNVDGKKLVLGTLFTQKLPQQQFDIVIDRDFELSHNWKDGSVYFYGYKAANPVEDEFPRGEFGDSESEEEIPLTLNGRPGHVTKQDNIAQAKKASAANEKKSDAGKQKVTIVEPNKAANVEEEEESSDDDFISEDADEDDLEPEDEDDSEDESDESDEEPENKLVQQVKKRHVESTTKSPVTDKKAKVTPQTTDEKKGGGHLATPHPAKQAGKTPVNQQNKQTPKSGGSHSCKSCNKSFASDKALESHTKAKHK